MSSSPIVPGIFGPRFKPTRSFQSIIDERKNVFEKFEKWPILEVREACLKQLEGWSHGIDDHIAQWAEDAIRDLAGEKLAEKLLSWYVFAPQDESSAVRALEFAISLSEEKMEFGSAIVSKIICGRICSKHWILYPAVPSLPNFIENLLNKLAEWGKFRDYFEIEWHCAERALKMVLHGEDFSFLPKIETILELFKAQKISPQRDLPLYTRDMHIAVFQSARRTLCKIQRRKIREALTPAEPVKATEENTRLAVTVQTVNDAEKSAKQ